MPRHKAFHHGSLLVVLDGMNECAMLRPSACHVRFHEEMRCIRKYSFYTKGMHMKVRFLMKLKCTNIKYILQKIYFHFPDRLRLFHEWAMIIYLFSFLVLFLVRTGRFRPS